MPNEGLGDSLPGQVIPEGQAVRVFLAGGLHPDL